MLGIVPISPRKKQKFSSDCLGRSGKVEISIIEWREIIEAADVCVTNCLVSIRVRFFSCYIYCSWRGRRLVTMCCVIVGTSYQNENNVFDL